MQDFFWNYKVLAHCKRLAWRLRARLYRIVAVTGKAAVSLCAAAAVLASGACSDQLTRLEFYQGASPAGGASEGRRAAASPAVLSGTTAQPIKSQDLAPPGTSGSADLASSDLTGSAVVQDQGSEAPHGRIARVPRDAARPDIQPRGTESAPLTALASVPALASARPDASVRRAKNTGPGNTDRSPPTAAPELETDKRIGAGPGPAPDRARVNAARNHVKASRPENASPENAPATQSRAGAPDTSAPTQTVPHTKAGTATASGRAAPASAPHTSADRAETATAQAAREKPPVAAASGSDITGSDVSGNEDQPRIALADAAAPPQFRWPVKGRIISSFGDIGATGRNDGIDLAVPEGTEVRSVADGTVIYAGEQLEGYGKLILIRHDDVWVSAYAHNSQVMVQRGDRVRRGDIVSRSGATGSVERPRLHFELRRNRVPVDPEAHLGAF